MKRKQKMAIDTARRHEILYQDMFYVQVYASKNDLSLSETSMTDTIRIKRAQEDKILDVIYSKWKAFFNDVV